MKLELVISALIIQIRELTICYQRSSAFCEECGKQTVIIDMRRCHTCEIELHKMLEYSLQVTIYHKICQISSSQ